jgi:pyruvate formate lyase activating enzyme
MGQIYDITPFTLLDYPNELACIVWISGCNLRCVYCHNPDIVLCRGTKEESELLSFLESRRGKLTAVVFSGGEATFYPGLGDLARKIKDMGFKIKLDTNGSNPEVLRKLVSDNLIDSVALDYKAPPYLLEKVSGTGSFEKAFSESLALLIGESKAGRVALEVRTTVSPEVMSEGDIGWIINDLDARGYRDTYWIQNVVASGEATLGKVAEAKRQIEQEMLPTPKNFTLGFRNFPKEPEKRNA